MEVSKNIKQTINNRSPTMEGEAIHKRMEADKESIEGFLKGSKQTFNFSAYRRLLKTELCYNGAFAENTVCGFTKKQIFDMARRPERYGKHILKLSQYMYLKSGYYKRLVNYFVGLHKACWTVDIEVKNANYLKSSLFRYIGKVNELKIEEELYNILLRVYLYDCCFGYLVETGYETYIHYLDPRYCEITRCANGSINLFSIKVYMVGKKEAASFPPELRGLIASAKEAGVPSVEVPIEKGLCIKYHDSFPYPYPPLFHIISDVLEIDDYKELSRAKTEQEAYRLLVMQIPTNDDHEIALGDDVVVPFVNMAKAIVPESIGIIPTPMKVEAVQFQAEQKERNKVEEAIDQLYSEEGVSKSLMSGATSGSELKMSMIVDASEIYRIYRQIEKWVNLQMKLRRFVYSSYAIHFSLLDVASFNQEELIDRELKLTQASIPNKIRLCATCGINPSKLFGNQKVENEILRLGQDWTPLATSFTRSSSADSGRPAEDDADLSKAGEQTRRDEGNDRDNRI